MGTMRFVLWTTTCVAVGVALGTVEVGSATPVQHVERLLRQKGPRLDQLKAGATNLVDEVNKKVSVTKPAGPTERHSAAERSAIDEIIAKRQK
jgi:hypothetical protein